MNILLLDDEKLALEHLEAAVAEVLPEDNREAFLNMDQALLYAKENPIDIAFLDINIQTRTSGLELAKQLMELYPKINIIFCTGYTDFALDAFNLYASGYITKPIRPGRIEEVLNHLRFPVEQKKRVRFHCFGNFEAYCDEKPILFKHKRTKELLAYLVDRDGVDCTTQEIIAGVFEDSISRMYLSQLRNDLIQSFSKLGIDDILRISRGRMAIERNAVACDYYDYLDGKTNNPPVEYMTQYSFGELTLGGLI